MLQGIVLFLKRTYKIFSVLICAVIFFAIYNTYLVDRSLVNLKVALDKVSRAQTLADFEKIKPLLKVALLKEISKVSADNKALIPLELASSMIDNAKTVEDLQDVKFYLKSVVDAKEKTRGGLLSALDRLNSQVYKPALELPQQKLDRDARSLLAKIEAAKDKTTLQQLYYDLGNIYLQSNNIPRAEEAFLKSIEADTQTPLALKAKFNLAWAYKSSGEYEKAVKYFSEVASEYSKTQLNITSKYEIADTLYKQGDYQKARDQYEQLSSEHPEFDLAELALYEAGCISYRNLNDKDAALKYLSKLEVKYPKAKIVQHITEEVRPTMAGSYGDTGYTLLREKLYAEAINNFRKAVEVYPLDSRSMSGMGLGFYWLNQKEEALGAAKKATEVRPDDEAAATNALFIYINSGRIDEAIKLGETLLARKGSTIKSPEFYHNLGYAYILKGRMSDASVDYGRAVKLNREFAYAHNNLGCVYWSQKNYADAIKSFKEAISTYPEYADAYYNLGVAYFFQNRYEDAYQQFKNTLGVNPQYKDAENYKNRIRDILQYEP